MTGSPRLRACTIARELLRKERRGEESACALRACRAVLDRLYEELETLIGRGAFHALLIRALALAGKDHPAVRQVDARQASAPGLSDLEQNLRELGPADPDVVVHALVTEFLELLVRVLGPELTRTILRSGWPEVMRTMAKTTGGEHDDD